MTLLRFLCLGVGLLWSPVLGAADRIALPHIPATLDPHKALTTAELALAQALFTGLVTRNAQGEIAPGLAESWTVNLTGTEYRFSLRQNQSWSDGQRITARTVIESLKRALDPATQAPFHALLLPIKNSEAFRLGTLPADQTLGLSAPDERTVVLTLDRPSHGLLAALASPVAAPVPLHRVASSGWAALPGVSGNGAFTLAAQHRAGTQNAVVPNSLVLKRSGTPASEIEISTDPAAAAHAVGFVAPATDGGHSAVYQLLVNTRHSPLKERDVRHALSMVIDRDALITALQIPMAQSAYGFAPDALQAPYAKLTATDRKTVAEALLLDAPRDRTLRVVLPDQPLHLAVGASLVDAWTPLGFKVEVHAIPPAAYERAVLDGDFDVAWMPPWTFGFSSTDSPRLDRLFPFSQAAGPWNAGGYREPVFDQHLASADADGTPEGRAQSWTRAEDILVEDQPVWPLFFYSSVSPQVLDVTRLGAGSPQ